MDLTATARITEGRREDPEADRRQPREVIRGRPGARPPSILVLGARMACESTGVVTRSRGLIDLRLALRIDGSRRESRRAVESTLRRS